MAPGLMRQHLPTLKVRVIDVVDLMEKGTTTPPFGMAVLNDLDRLHLAADVIDRVPTLGYRAAHLRQAMRDKLIEHREYIGRHGQDMPEILEWRWRIEITPNTRT